MGGAYPGSGRRIGVAVWVACGREVALRDYVLTSESPHRDEYERSIQDVHLQLGNLRRLTADNAEQRQNIEALAALVTARGAAMTRALSAFADDGLEAAHAAMALDRGARSTLEVRELTNRMVAIEKRLLAARRTASTKVRETTRLSLLTTLAVACGVFTALFRGIRREIRARRRGESDLREANSFLDSLIENLPVMIVLKEAKSLCYFRINRAVEQVFGRSREQMIGRSVHEFLPAEAAAAVSASDRQALGGDGVVDNPEHRVQTATLGLLSFIP